MKTRNFSEPVMRRIITPAPMTREFTNRAPELHQASKAPEGKQLAQK